MPVVVVRGRDGKLRAFVNVCRHRGSEIVSERGRRETLQCPYHAWTYELDGRLRAAPRSEREAGFDPRELGLVPAAVDTWGPFVFVHADANAPALQKTLADLPQLIDPDTASILPQAGGAQRPGNWKVAVENYLECYHCAVAHPGFCDSSTSIRTRTASRVWRAAEPVRPGAAAATVPANSISSGPRSRSTCIRVSCNLSIGPVWPVEPERTDGFLDYYFGEGVTRGEAAGAD